MKSTAWIDLFSCDAWKVIFDERKFPELIDPVSRFIKFSLKVLFVSLLSIVKFICVLFLKIS